MKKWVLFFLWLPALMAALEEKSFFVKSDNALFDGNLLTLRGNIRLDHSLGQIRSQKALLEGLNKDTQSVAMHLYLKDGVDLIFTNNARLRSQTAHFDYQEKTVSFESKGQEEKVFYSDNILKKDGSYSPLQLECLHATAGLLQKTNLKALTFVDIQQLYFLDEVEITLENTLKATGGKAVFKRNSVDLDGKEKKILGMLDLYPAIPDRYCRLCRDEDEIFATVMHFDCTNSILSFEQPKGMLYVQRNEPLLFSANFLSWDKKTGTLLLKDSVEAKENGFAYLKSDQIELFQKLGEPLTSIVATGATEMTFLEKQQDHPRLICQGKIVLDHGQQSIEAWADPEQSLLFHDGKIALAAEKAHLIYDERENHIHCEKIIFEGSVRFLAEQENSHSFGIADLITYYPTDKQVVLNSLSSQRVLLWHDDDSLRLSAKEVHIRHDSVNHTQIAEGIGDVRFSFDPQEENQMRKLFHHFLK